MNRRDTRATILALLCGGKLTVTELARKQRMSNNTIRAHLDRLEADGLVRYEVVRRGVGKPAHEYELTEEGSRLLSRAYLPLFSRFLAASTARQGPAQVETLLREAGRSLAQPYPKPTGALRERADAAANLLEELGGSSSVQEEGGELWIEGACCPLHTLVPEHPLTCKAMEALLGEYLDAPVREHCRKQYPPTCRLRVG
jgi:predicted ArsR family transcriptional regulator